MRSIWMWSAASVALAAAVIGQGVIAQDSRTATVDPATMKRVGAIDERFQSYNVEMVEVTGGRFWKPYGAVSTRTASSGQQSSAEGGAAAPSGMDPSLYEYRPPLDLANRHLRAMAAALAPAYMRVSGTWANTTYFADTATPPKEPPTGYGAVLTRDQWLGVIAFSRAVDAAIVTSMPVGVGTRGPDQAWRPDQARTWLAFTRASGGTVAAAEYFNEPTLATMGGAPKGYDAAAYGRDHRAFTSFMRKEFPGTTLLAPGSVGEADADWAVASGGYGDQKLLSAADLARSTGDADVFSYHHYGAVSQRCAAMGHQTRAEDALSEDWLGRTDKTLAYYRGVRDRMMPGKPFWNTETGETACGGNPWAKTYLDTFRYLDQLGRLAGQGVQVVAHNTLAASDYSLIDEKTYEPHPSFWGALLWRRLMGTTVLDAGVQNRAGLHLYAHCLRGVPGGVAMLLLNTSPTETTTLSMPVAADRYTLTARELTAGSVMFNDRPLALGTNDQLPTMAGEATAVGPLNFAPTSITFVALPSAENSACR
jgi:heparanase 1